MFIKPLTVVILIALSAQAHSKGMSERDYQSQHCKGIIEHVLPDKTRVDCLTETHAIEYDFAKKWAEAIGQSLGYAMMTGKRAGIVLIIENQKDIKKLDKLKAVIKHYQLPIDVWALSSEI